MYPVRVANRVPKSRLSLDDKGQRQERQRPRTAIRVKVAKGHEARVNKLIEEKRLVLVYVYGSMQNAQHAPGLPGIIIDHDRFTITLAILLDGEVVSEATFFKHAVECFRPFTPKEVEDWRAKYADTLEKGIV